MELEPGDRTRAALIAAAERLMAERGIDGVELKDIVAAAGQRNRSAIAYHFGDRGGLVKAIGAKHRPPINAERNALLDRLGPDPSVAELVRAVVMPLSRSLETASGRAYVIIVAESAARLGTAQLYEAERVHIDSIRRVAALLDQRLEGSAARRRLMIGQMILAVPTLLADLARDVDRDALTIAQAKRRVPTVTRFVAGGLVGTGEPGAG